jgi:hypothetical protein
MFLAVPMIAMIHFHAIRRESSSLALADHLEKFELPDSDDMQRSPLGTKLPSEMNKLTTATGTSESFMQVNNRAYSRS